VFGSGRIDGNRSGYPSGSDCGSLRSHNLTLFVIFLNAGTRKTSLHLGGDRHTYLEFRYLACDLKRLSANDYKDSNNIIARLNLPNMHYPKQERLQIYLAAQLGLPKIEPNPNKQRKYIYFIDFYANLSEQ